MRVFGIKAPTVAAVVTLATLLVMPRLSVADGLEGYCCVCNSCSAPPPVQCISVLANGSQAADCENRCTSPSQGCQFLEVLEGGCDIHAAECMPSPAPAASRPVLLVLAILLAGGGVYLVRRRVTR